MTVMARRFVSIPGRTASATWKAISNLLSTQEQSEAARELASVSGIAASLITREAMRSPIVLHGSGPRVRVYCLYNEDAIEGDDANEAALPFDATAGEWRLSLPCPAEDLHWVQNSLQAKSTRISARDMAEALDDDTSAAVSVVGNKSAVDLEAFFKS